MAAAVPVVSAAATAVPVVTVAAGAATAAAESATFYNKVGKAYEGVQNALNNIFDKIHPTVSPGTTSTFPIWQVILILLISAFVFYWYWGVQRLLETPTNIARILKENLKAANHYATDAPKRKGLHELYNSLKDDGFTDEDLILTNFYISTVNATGLFYPAVDGIIAPDAARLATLAGARAFVFDIWPDLSPGGDFGPTIEVMDFGSYWRRTTLNALPLATILQAVVQTALPPVGNMFNSANPGSILPAQGPQGQGKQDPVILYLRFRGAPREETFDGVADALASTILPYRLEASFNNCRRADKLFQIPIKHLFSKVIVVSNNRGSGQFSDFVNFAPRAGIPLEYDASQLPLIVGASEKEVKDKILMNLTFVSPQPEYPIAQSNQYNQAKAQSLGIHCVGMNFFQDGKPLKEYLDEDMFKTYSYMFKPADLRYTVTHLTPPRAPPNPDWGDNTQGKAGDLRPPAAIRLP
jgi:hypothetical protein